MTTNKQLELGFNPNRSGGSSVTQHKGRVVRAGWWFAQMREIVECAMDWRVAGQPPAEQIWIPGMSREVKV